VTVCGAEVGVSWGRFSNKIYPLEVTVREFITQYKKTENSVFMPASDDLLRAFRVAAPINGVTTVTEKACRDSSERNSMTRREKNKSSNFILTIL
jgi:hypothetical protein